MAAPVQPNYAELADGLHKIAEQAQHLPNANPAQIFARLDNLQQDQQQILLILHQIMEGQAQLRRDILLAESRSSARGLNSTSGITGVLCFPRTEEGDIPQELALRSPQQLAVLEEHELDAYIQFYRLEGETRVAKLQNLGRFLGCKLL
uniref:Uncharacterized protein n=1 Tax=Tetraselmis sp. GSL018 TaxID=582737 RepID=A0A061S120_9CHLO|eukprot:CAMPEP_0177604968 /NCGR_PEP_ID=MMETSP0419_2-20121207/16424_1 /TAXON_ID=582737 /ORGANISM="Tetraselmis sp., Strain GSL018" /LENGTH=148 /DNA_ID=CAMNT_0019099033 /DNA_START=210 /DNA_END=656 /DNA_ORIENTATION=-